MACIYGIEQSCAECGMCGNGEKKFSNADRIRIMTDTELSKIIMCPYDIGADDCHKDIGCLKCCEEWLRKECDEDGEIYFGD